MVIEFGLDAKIDAIRLTLDERVLDEEPVVVQRRGRRPTKFLRITLVTDQKERDSIWQKAILLLKRLTGIF